MLRRDRQRPAVEVAGQGDPLGVIEARRNGAGGEEGEQPVGEEASLTPLQIPGDLRV